MNATQKRDSTNWHGKRADKVLGAMSIADIKAFLTHTANLPWALTYPDHRWGLEYWLKRWQKLFTYRKEVVPQYDGPSLDAVLNGDAEVIRESPPSRILVKATAQVPSEQLELFAELVRTTLRRLWVEKDNRQRDWYCYRLRDVHRQMVRHLEGWEERPIWGGSDTPVRLTDYALQEVPRVSPFEAAICWLQFNYRLMLHCANPLCDTPYFLRPEKSKRQDYCSPECADPARKAAKLKWWNEHRKNQRKSRK
jgi:hypothetical protein